MEAGAEACRRVQQAVVEPLADLSQQGCHLLLGDGAATGADRRRQQVQPRNVGMLHDGGVQVAAVLGHVGKIHEGPVAEAQRQVQIPQADVAVQTQHLLAAEGQRGAGAGHEGGLARAALAGHHGDTLSRGCHGRPPYHIFVLTLPILLL